MATWSSIQCQDVKVIITDAQVHSPNCLRKRVKFCRAGLIKLHDGYMTRLIKEGVTEYVEDHECCIKWF